MISGRFVCPVLLANRMAPAKKIGLIAGAGALPEEVIGGIKAQGFDVFIADVAGGRDWDSPSQLFTLGEIGGVLKAFRTQNCTDIVFAGHVLRPDFKKLKLDFYAVKILPSVLSSARKGDEALLKYLVGLFEKEGFSVLSPQDFCGHILMPSGYLGEVQASAEQKTDIEKALDIAAVIGAHDIGQAAIVCRGLVLAVEAQEGTDAMLIRTAALDAKIRGSISAPAGVLLKRLKPGQETRTDLPTIGVRTVKLAAEAGLAGIALAAGQAFVLGIDKVRAEADKRGLFIYGLDADGN